MHYMLVLIMATIMWGLWGYAEKRAVELAHPLTVQWMYTTIYVVALPVMFLVARRFDAAEGINWAAYRWAALAALLAIGAVFAFLVALRGVDASVAVAIMAAYPIFTLIPSVLTGAETLTVQKVAGIVIIIVGVALLTR